MMNNNKKDFTALMYGLFATYDKVFNQTQVDIYWNVLAKYSFEQVDHAINQHLLTAKYFPRPAEIIELIDNASGNAHMDSSEAWAIALSANDESNTVIWTDEMHKAWVISKNVMDIGDEVGARKAFIEAYERLVRESVIQGKKINVTVSIGFDKSKRTEAINRAMFTGLLSSHEGQKYLPKPENTFAMLENKTAVPKAKGIPQSLLKIKAQIQAQKEQSKSQWEIEKNHLHDSLKERYEQQKQALERGIANV